MEEAPHLRHYPVGTTVPDSVHAVCCSLPTMQDVIGYEECRAETLAVVKVGYPRFLPHHYVRRAAEWAAQKLSLSGPACYAVASNEAAQELVEFACAKESQIAPEAGFFCVTLSADEGVLLRAKRYLQHTGLSISSRQAEDYLIAEGQLKERFPEKYVAADAEAYVRGALQQYVASEQIKIACSGMSAFYSAFKTVRDIQRKAGRKVYLQLGWLYLDTQKILEEFLEPDEEVITFYDIFDREKLEALFVERGSEIAAVITELPTNPLVQTLDVAHLSALAREAGALCIYDPSLTSVANVNVLPHTDVLVSSLTKYASNQGDVMIGFAAVNPASPWAAQLGEKLSGYIVPPYERDLQRCAWEMQDWPDLVDRINQNTIELAAYLENHPVVRKVFWSFSNESAAQYAKIAVGENRPGGIISIELNKPLAAFYDRSFVVKGPSFGTYFTMMCPFMYLAHYDWVTNDAKRAELRALDLDPDLVRISVGTEPIAAIIEALEAGLSD